jgi:two-component system, OmpR family, phosphate regulon sensor histidine kinase PhoR
MAALPDTIRALIDALDEPALIVADERTVVANRPARELLGHSIEGSDVRLAIRHPEALQLLLAGRQGDLDLVGIGGIDRPWTLSIRPIDKSRFLVRLADRSAGRAAERMRTDFVANASHELRTPLATIIGYAETLADDHQSANDMTARFGATIETEARRMLRIIEDLMSLSRIEADRYQAPDEQVDLGEIVNLAVEQAKPLGQRRNCRVETAIEPALPPIVGDFGQLLQLADNLIANAIRYGCNDKSSTISVSARRDGSRVAFSVSDNGDGIVPEHLPRLTERFYRVDSARSRESGGTGLGLAIVKHIVERHRGTLDIRSKAGAGTQVTVSLPAA